MREEDVVYSVIFRAPESYEEVLYVGIDRERANRIYEQEKRVGSKVLKTELSDKKNFKPIDPDDESVLHEWSQQSLRDIIEMFEMGKINTAYIEFKGIKDFGDQGSVEVDEHVKINKDGRMDFK